MPGDPGRAFASMGNYLFRPDVLRDALRAAVRRGEYDFGRHVMPRLIQTHRVYAYDFVRNVVPGVRPHEERSYWRDVGTVEAYMAAHRDLLGLRPRFRLDNPAWPIQPGTPAGHERASDGADFCDSILGPGTQSRGASVRRSVLQRGARIEPGATVEDCIVMENVRVPRGVHLRGMVVGS
jgi:glucose-1-phosphate adenylyltransferase